MNKNLFTSILIIIVFIFVTFYFINQKEQYKKIILNNNDVTYISTLKNKEGVTLGKIYVTYISKDIFKSLYVAKEVDDKNIIIYKVNDTGFSNTLGKDLEISQGGFYGYQFSLIKDEYFVLHYLTDNGNSVSDDVTVKWNNDKNVFEVQKTP